MSSGASGAITDADARQHALLIDGACRALNLAPREQGQD